MTRWICEDCGWECSPNPTLPLANAECDNCGGPIDAVGVGTPKEKNDG